MVNAGQDQPLITLGLPVYNCQPYVSQSIESLLAQTYKDFVLIISDNASTDGTSEICANYARQDARIRYCRNERNIGLPANYNRVFHLTESKYLKWSTGDDYWTPDMLMDALEILEGEPSVALCYPKAVLVDASGREQARYEDRLHLMQDDPVERFLTLLAEIRLSHQNLGVMRMDMARRTALVGNHVGSDVTFLAELSLYGKFFEAPRYQYFRRLHENSYSWNRGNELHEARRYHPAGVTRIPFNTWKHHAGFWKAVVRSPLAISQKVRILPVLLKRLYWDGQTLTHELIRDLPLLRSGKLSSRSRWCR